LPLLKFQPSYVCTQQLASGKDSAVHIWWRTDK